MKNPLIGMLLVSIFLGDISLASESKECRVLIGSVSNSQDPHPAGLSAYLGREKSEFPCEEAGGEGAGSTYGVRTYKLGGRIAVLLTKEEGDPGRARILDAILLPRLGKGESYLGSSLCVHKVPRAPAIAVGKPINSDYRVRSAWVIDREVQKILKVSSSAVKCERDPGASP